MSREWWMRAALVVWGASLVGAMFVGGVAISPLVLAGGALAGAALGVAIAYGWSYKKGVVPKTRTLVDAALFGGVIGAAGFAYAPALLGGSIVVMPATTASAGGAVAATTVTSVLVAERDAREIPVNADVRPWDREQAEKAELAHYDPSKPSASKGLVGALEQKAR